MNAAGYRDDAPNTALAFCLSVLLHGLLAASLIAFFWRHVQEMPPPSTPFEMVAAPADAQDSPAPAAQPAETAPAQLQQLPAPMFPNVPHVVTPPQPVAQTAPQPVPPAQSKPVVKPTPAAPAVTPATHAPSTPAKPAAPTSTMSYDQFVAAHGPPKPTPAGAPSSSPVSKPRYVPDVGLQDSVEQNQLSQIAAGSGRGTAGSPAGTPTASQKSDYLAYLAGRLLEAFTLPPGVSGLKADVTITISPQGRVLKRVITGSSGNKEFDDAVQAAMDLLVNVDPPPPGSPSSFPLTFVPSPK